MMAFVDNGATNSFVNQKWVERMGWEVTPKAGKIVQFMDGSEIPRIGVVEGLTLENGHKILQVDLEVAKLSDDEDMVIGMDLFKPLGFELLGVSFAWPTREVKKEKKR